MSEWVRLGDVCNVLSGFAFKSSEFQKEGIPIIRIGDINEEKVSLDSCVYYPKEFWEMHLEYQIKKGDILIAMSGATVGKIGYYQLSSPALLNQRVANLRVKNNTTSGFIFYFLLSSRFDEFIQLNAFGCAQPNISSKDILNLKLVLPSLSEQQHIVSVLDTVNSLIDARKKQIALLDEAEKSLFVEMFGDSKHNPMNWKTVKLETLADVGSSKRVFVNQLQNVGIPFYRGTEIGLLAEKKEINPELFITNEHYEELINATGKPEIGDLLMPSICSDGRIWIVNHRTPFYFKDGRVLWVHKQDITKVDSCYLKYVLKEKIMTDYLSIASGTTFAELKIFALKALLVMLPPLSLQKEFAARISAIEDHRREMEAGLQQMEEVRSALMQQYFG